MDLYLLIAVVLLCPGSFSVCRKDGWSLTLKPMSLVVVEYIIAKVTATKPPALPACTHAAETPATQEPAPF